MYNILLDKIQLNSDYPLHGDRFFRLGDIEEAKEITEMAKETSAQIIDRLTAMSKPSNWMVKAQWRQDNQDWLNISSRIAIAILQYMREEGITKQAMAEKVGIPLDLMNKIVKGSENMTLEVIVKIEKVVNKKIFTL